jgi:mediator of RNA polymerase II transcription subunit 18
MPHEIFLSAIVVDTDEARARALLGGYTEMRERHVYTRIQHYEPQDRSIKGLPTIKQLLKEPTPSNAQWQELHQILVKQPSVLNLRFDVTESVQNAMTRSVAL